MEIKDFFSPVDLSIFNDGEPYAKNRMGTIIKIFSTEGEFPNLENVKLAIIGV